MKLGSLKSSRPDGDLCLISKDLTRAVKATDICANLRETVERWPEVEMALKARASELESGKCAEIFEVRQEDFLSALPRTWLFADGSAFIHHIRLVRKARNAEPPETLMTVPLMYQAESGRFLSPREDIPQVDFSHGTDFEGEVGVVVDHVPMGISPDEALKKIRLIVLINDVSLRGLIPAELAMGFGFFQSKPTKALSPFAVTPDELGSAWRGGRVHLPLHVRLNGEFFGKANAGHMHFHFGDLIAHAARTRDLAAGSLIGSGTVSNEDASVGSSCLVEKRTIEQIETGQAKTPYMKDGDVVEISMVDEGGRDLFGVIRQRVKAHQR